MPVTVGSNHIGRVNMSIRYWFSSTAVTRVKGISLCLHCLHTLKHELHLINIQQFSSYLTGNTGCP